MGRDGFMCHDMLYWHTVLLRCPGSSWVCPAEFNPVYPQLTTSYKSPVSTLSLSHWIFLFFCLRLYICVYSSASALFFTHFSPPVCLSSTETLAKEVFTLYSLAVCKMSSQDNYDDGLHALACLLCCARKNVCSFLSALSERSVSLLHIMRLQETISLSQCKSKSGGID